MSGFPGIPQVSCIELCNNRRIIKNNCLTRNRKYYTIFKIPYYCNAILSAIIYLSRMDNEPELP